ncbi:MAG: hypothetical protein WD022_02155 [Balneolaceae bacterium]
MQITTDVKQLSPDFKKPHGGYEWWYFDGLSEDGEDGFVVIFYQNNPFSTKYIEELEGSGIQQDHPAISISVYKNKKTVYYGFVEFDEKEFSWNEEEKTLKLEKNLIKYSISQEKVEIELHLNQVLPSGHLIKGMISGTGLIPANQFIEKGKSSEMHCWNLLLPDMEFETKLNVTGKSGEEEFNIYGSGYHDHNTGNEPMGDSFKDWYWGRYHFGDLTLIYYLMNKRDGSQQFEAWIIDSENQRVVESLDEVKLNFYSRNLFGMKSARKIELDGSQASVIIQCNTKIDDGPFYQRFYGDSIIKYNTQVYAAHGISEYLYPENIYKRLFWPLVHMRLRYADQNPHWVQKSRLLYPWTW